MRPGECGAFSMAMHELGSSIQRLLSRGPSLTMSAHHDQPNWRSSASAVTCMSRGEPCGTDGRGGGLSQPLDQGPHRRPVEDAAAAHRGAAGEPHQQPLLPGLAVAGAIGLIGDDRQRLGKQGRVGEIGQSQRVVASGQDPGQVGRGAEEEGAPAELLQREPESAQFGEPPPQRRGLGKADLDQQRFRQGDRFRGWTVPRRSHRRRASARRGCARGRGADRRGRARRHPPAAAGARRPGRSGAGAAAPASRSARRRPRGAGVSASAVSASRARAAAPVSGSQRNRNGRRPSASRTSSAMAAAISRSSRNRTSSLAGWTLTSTRRGSTSMARRSTG